MTHVERITPIVKLDLKLQCQSQVYAIIVMYSQVPNNRPPPTVNFLKFFYPGDFYSKPPFY